jgi:Ca2+-binding RTX toxin-like protein
VLSDGYHTETFRGAFQYDFYDNVYGTLDSVAADAGAQRIASITGIGVDANQAYEYYQYGTAEEFFGYLLSGNDRIVTTNYSDYLRGFTGNDSIDGRGGNDYIRGETGLDRLYGGNGSDYLDGGPGGDLMAGGMGNDRFFSDNPNDRIVEAANEASTPSSPRSPAAWPPTSRT